MQNTGTDKYAADVGRIINRQMADRKQEGRELHQDRANVLVALIWKRLDEIIEKLAEIEEILREK